MFLFKDNTPSLFCILHILFQKYFSDGDKYLIDKHKLISRKISECLNEIESKENNTFILKFIDNFKIDNISWKYSLLFENTLNFEIINIYLHENKSNWYLKHRGIKGNTPLHMVCGNKNISFEIIKYLVENKSNMNSKNCSDGETPLHIACKNENISLEIIECLVENKSDLNLSESSFENALHIARKNKNNLYFKHRGIKGNTPLHIACENENISFEIIEYLVENKSDINLKDTFDYTPLHLACKNKNISSEIIKCLVEKKSDLNSKDTYNKNPLQFASENENISVEIIEYLELKK